MSEASDRGTRRAVAWMFVVATAMSAISVFISVHQIDASEHKFCAVISAATAHPVPRPVDPKANPSRENAYAFYQDFVRLGDQLGCGTGSGIRTPPESGTLAQG